MSAAFVPSIPSDVGAEPANANIQTHIGINSGNPHGATAAMVGAEPALPSPSTDGYVLVSTAAGIRSFVSPATIVAGGLISSKNLFNPANLINNKFLNSGTGDFSTGTGWKTTDYIPVVPGKPYTSSWTGTKRNGMSFFTDQKAYITNSYESSLTNPLTKTAPATAAYVVYNYQDASGTGPPNSFMVEQNDHATAYQAYFDPYLPAATGLSGTVTVANSDKIVAIGDSYTESGYALPGKAYLQKVAAFLDYVVDNFAVSGETYQTNLARIRSGAATYGVSWAALAPKYALCISYTNDMKYSDMEQYLDDLRSICEVVRSTGAEPLIADEYHSDSGDMIVPALSGFASERKIPFLNILAKTRLLVGTPYAPFWSGSHPGTRANDLFTGTLLPYLKQLPRPRQSMKIFRKRSAITVSSVDDLMYDTNEQRTKVFQEILIGQKSLTAAYQKYYDDLNVSYQNELLTSEYAKLMLGQSVSFSDYAAIDVILPCTERNLTSVKLAISDVTVTVYARNTLATPYEGTTRYQQFIISAGNTIVPGDTYTSNLADLSGVALTVIGTATDRGNLSMICSTSPSKDGSNVVGGAGTLTRTSGTGTASISYSHTAPGFEAAYYTNFGKPEGHWQQLTLTSSAFPLPSISGYVQGDKVSFLLYKSGGFSLTGATVSWAGSEDKVRLPQSEIKLSEPSGTELMTQPLCGTLGQLASWTVTGSLTPSSPYDSCLPTGTTGMVEVDTSNYMSQTVTYTADSLLDREMQITVWARRLPAKFAYTGSFPSGSTITNDSFDYATLTITVGNGSVSVPFRQIVGLHWWETRLKIIVPATSTSRIITISSSDVSIQVAKVSAKFV